MAAQQRSAEVKADSKNRPGVRQVAGEELTGDLARLPGDSIRSQATWLGDVRLQTVQRQALATQIGQVQGNGHLQRVVAVIQGEPASPRLETRALMPLRQRSAKMMARSLATAEQRAGTSRAGTWSGLSAPDRAFLERRVAEAGDQPGLRPTVLQEMAARLGWSLLPRITLQVTANLGVVGGVEVTPTTGEGMVLAYVPINPACAGAFDVNHWQLHSRDEIRAYMQINPSLFTTGTAAERVNTLHSTLMHEYTHVEQYIAEGISAQTGFNRQERLGKEFLRWATARRDLALMGALAEIDAASAEIENAAQTRLGSSERVVEAVSYIWASYLEYRAVGETNMNRDVVDRAYYNIHRGRIMLMDFIDSAPGYQAVATLVVELARSRGRAVQPREVIDSWLYRCPLRYEESRIGPLVTDANARAEASRQAARRSQLMADMARIGGEIRRRAR